MTKSPFLGEFEQLVLLSVARLGSAAYGVRIQAEIADRSRRHVAIGSVYAALDRMERKGLLSSLLGEPTPERGGRAKRYYRLDALGLDSLRRSRETLESFWEDLDLDSEAYI